MGDVREARWHEGYEVRFLAEAEHYVMVQRLNILPPYVMHKPQWLALPLAAEGRKAFEEYRDAMRWAEAGE